MLRHLDGHGGRDDAHPHRRAVHERLHAPAHACPGQTQSSSKWSSSHIVSIGMKGKELTLCLLLERLGQRLLLPHDLVEVALQQAPRLRQQANVSDDQNPHVSHILSSCLATASKEFESETQPSH